MTENILKDLLLKSKSVYLIFNMTYLLAHVDSSPGPSSFLPSALLPSLSLPCPPRIFISPSHFQTWLAVPHSPLDSSFFLHFPILTLTLPPRLSPLFRSWAFWGHACHCPMGLLLALRHWGTNPAPSPLPSHTALMPNQDTM